MASIYDRSSNIYFQDYREVTLDNSGWFKLKDEDARVVTIMNTTPQAINVAKTTAQSDPGHTLTAAQEAAFTTPIVSGTALVTGRHITIESDIFFEIKGITNSNQASFRKFTHTTATQHVQYIIEK